MKECINEVNGLSQKDNRQVFINAIGLYKHSRQDIKVYESVEGTSEAIANIFLNSNDERMKDIICKTFDKYSGVFYAKWTSDEDIGYDYKVRIDLDHIPKKVCKEFIKVSKWIDKQILADEKNAKRREIKLSKLEIKLRKKANLSIFKEIAYGLKKGR